MSNNEKEIRCFCCQTNLVSSVMAYCSDCKRELARELDEAEKEPGFTEHDPANLDILEYE